MMRRPSTTDEPIDDGVSESGNLTPHSGKFSPYSVFFEGPPDSSYDFDFSAQQRDPLFSNEESSSNTMDDGFTQTVEVTERITTAAAATTTTVIDKNECVDSITSSEELPTTNRFLSAAMDQDNSMEGGANVGNAHPATTNDSGLFAATHQSCFNVPTIIDRGGLNLDIITPIASHHGLNLTTSTRGCLGLSRKIPALNQVFNHNNNQSSNDHEIHIPSKKLSIRSSDVTSHTSGDSSLINDERSVVVDGESVLTESIHDDIDVIELMKAKSVFDKNINVDHHCLNLLNKLYPLVDKIRKRNTELSLTTPLIVKDDTSGDILFLLKEYAPLTRRSHYLEPGIPALIVAYLDNNSLNQDSGNITAFGGRPTILPTESDKQVIRRGGKVGRLKGRRYELLRQDQTIDIHSTMSTSASPLLPAAASAAALSSSSAAVSVASSSGNGVGASTANVHQLIFDSMNELQLDDRGKRKYRSLLNGRLSDLAESILNDAKNDVKNDQNANKKQRNRRGENDDRLRTLSNKTVEKLSDMLLELFMANAAKKRWSQKDRLELRFIVDILNKRKAITPPSRALPAPTTQGVDNSLETMFKQLEVSNHVTKDTEWSPIEFCRSVCEAVSRDMKL